MSQPFSIRPGAMDTDTLGYWRFGERGGRLTGLVGPDLTNYGATPEDGGYRFVAAEIDSIEGVIAGQPAHSQLTLECWVRYSRPPTAAYAHAQMLNIRLDGTNLIGIVANRRTDPTLSQIGGRLTVGGVGVGVLIWQGAEVDALLASPEWWHVAAVLDAPNTFRLFVNGDLRATDATGILALPAGDYPLCIGKYRSGAGTYPFGGILDEVRISKAARHSANFSIVRFGEGERAGLRGPGETVEVAGGCV